MTKTEFVGSMESLCGFYEKKLNETQLEQWFRIFKNLKRCSFDKAIFEHIARDEFNTFPAPGKITKMVETLFYDLANGEWKEGFLDDRGKK